MSSVVTRIATRWGWWPNKESDESANGIAGLRDVTTPSLSTPSLSTTAPNAAVPSAAALIIRFLKEPVKSRKDKAGGETIHDGNITFDNVLEVARTMRPRSMAKTFSGTVKEILGTCYSVGCTVDDQHPSELQTQIDDGELEVPSE